MKKEHLLKILRAPYVSEKANNATESDNQYVFRVQNSARKLEIKKAIELVFNVKVKSVQTLIRKGKVKRTMRGIGKRSNMKLAYVGLEAGQNIDLTRSE